MRPPESSAHPTQSTDRPAESRLPENGEADPGPGGIGRGLWNDLLRLRRGPLFVTLAFIGMMAGGLIDWLGGPAFLAWIGFAVAYGFGGWEGVKASVQSLREGRIDIDILMVLAALGALVVDAPFEGAMLLFLFSLSNVLQHYALGRSRRAIEELMELRPEEAQVVREDGSTETRALDEVEVGDVVRVRPGGRIPLDGIVEAGESAVDQSPVTGESVPVEKEPGADVFAGTLSDTGNLDIRVTRTARESTLARLIEMVEEAQSERAPTQQLLERIEQPYAIGVLVLTAFFILVPVGIWNEAFDAAFYRAMTLMVAASPCALIISTPAAVLSAIAGAARSGVLYKGGAYVEATADIRAVAFDKTGTLTTGETELTECAAQREAMVEGEPVSENDVLRWAAAVQRRSEHHLAEATVEAAQKRDLSVPPAEAFEAEVGRGVRAQVDEATIHIGNLRYFKTDRFDGAKIKGFEEARSASLDLREGGHTLVFVARENDEETEIIGWMGFADQLRPGARETIESLRALGIERIIMLTGDNEVVAQNIAEEVGVDAYYAELLPEEKVELLKELEDTYGGVLMVGDGINDAPALATATVGMAMGGAGTDVALETADIALMADELKKIPYTLNVSRATRRTLHVNFGIAFSAIGIMVVAILWTGLPLPIAVIGHEGSTVLVSLNGLRLLGLRA